MISTLGERLLHRHFFEHQISDRSSQLLVLRLEFAQPLFWAWLIHRVFLTPTIQRLAGNSDQFDSVIERLALRCQRVDTVQFGGNLILGVALASHGILHLLEQALDDQEVARLVKTPYQSATANPLPAL